MFFVEFDVFYQREIVLFLFAGLQLFDELALLVNLFLLLGYLNLLLFKGLLLLCKFLLEIFELFHILQSLLILLRGFIFYCGLVIDCFKNLVDHILEQIYIDIPIGEEPSKNILLPEIFRVFAVGASIISGILILWILFIIYRDIFNKKFRVFLLFLL